MDFRHPTPSAVAACSSRPSMHWRACIGAPAVAILLLHARTSRARPRVAGSPHEVAILRRHVKRPELLPANRLLRAALGRRLPVGRLLFTPATVLRWQRDLVRRRVIVRRQRFTASSTRIRAPPEASRSAPRQWFGWSVRQLPSGNERYPRSSASSPRPSSAVMIEFSRPTQHF